MQNADGTCNLNRERVECCPDPECKHAQGFLHQVRHISRCGNRRVRKLDKSRAGAVHSAGEHGVKRAAGSAVTGLNARREVGGVFQHNNKQSVDILFANADGKDLYVDVTGVDPFAKKVQSMINRFGNVPKRRVAPGPPIGTDYLDEMAGCVGCIRKYTEINEVPPPDRLIAGQMYVKDGKMKKHIKNRSQVIFRDFVVQHTGKIGDGARGVLKILAIWTRKRLGRSRSKTVAAQVRAWAR